MLCFTVNVFDPDFRCTLRVPGLFYGNTIVPIVLTRLFLCHCSSAPRPTWQRTAQISTTSSGNNPNRTTHGFISYFFKKSKSFLPPAFVVRREGNSFTLFVSPHLGGYPYPIMLCNISQNAMGQRVGYPASQGGYPGWGGTLAGGTLAWGGTLPGGYPGRTT